MRKLSAIVIVGIMLALLAAACSSPTATPVPIATTAVVPTATATRPPASTQAAATATPVPATPTKAATATTAAPTPTAVPEVIKVGQINPLTGSGAPWGIAANSGVDLAAEDINAKGGVTVGGKRYVFEIVKEDDKYLAASGVAAANKLIFQDKVKFLVGALASASVSAWTPISEENKVINVIDTWMGPEILQGKKYTFRFADGGMMPPIHHSLPHWKLILQQNPNLKTFVMTTPNDQSGWDTAQSDIDAAVSLGMKLVGVEFYERTVTDFRPLVTKLLALNPDIVDIKGSPSGSAALLVKTFREMGYKGKFQGTGWKSTDLMKVASKTDVEGIYGVEPATTGPELLPKVEAFFKRQEAKLGSREPFGAACYDMLPMLVEGIKKADSLDPDKIAAALESLAGTKFDMLWGETTIGGKAFYGRNAQIMSPIPIMEIRDGRNTTLAMSPPNETPLTKGKWW